VNDRVAVVTGGASGLGWAISERLASDGYRVVILDRSEQAAGRVDELERRGLRALAVRVDLVDANAIPRVASDLLKDVGRCDVLVNNAGTHFKRQDGQRFGFDEIQLSDWDRTIALHMTAPMLLCQAFLPGMQGRRWGRVINIASRTARTYTRQASASYAASKAGLVGLTRSIAGEYASFGITCNAIAPGRFETPLTAISSDEVKQFSLQELPVGRLGQPAEVGAAVAYLASDNAGFITGAVLDMNGGGFMAP
jgi:3-oxoacyl-[acyl-carrier protein] reductase